MQGGDPGALVDEGVEYIQIDAPRYSYYIDPKWRQLRPGRRWASIPETALDEAIRVDNACLEGSANASTGVTLAMHLCRGNNRSQWYAEGGYDPIAEKLFNQLNVDRVPARVRTERAGTFERAAVRAALEVGRARTRQQQASRARVRRRPDAGGSTKRAATCRSRTWR